MNSVCDAPRSSSNPVNTFSFSARNAATSGRSRGNGPRHVHARRPGRCPRAAWRTDSPRRTRRGCRPSSESTWNRLAGHQALDQVKRLIVAEFLDRPPDFLRVLQFLDAHGRRLRARLEQPRGRHVGQKVPHIVVPDDWREFGHADAEPLGFGPHRQLVAEQAGAALIEARQPQVIAQVGDQFDVEIVERDDAGGTAGCGRDTSPH